MRDLRLLFLQHKRLAFFGRKRILDSPKRPAKVDKTDTHSVIGWHGACEMTGYRSDKMACQGATQLPDGRDETTHQPHAESPDSHLAR